MFGYEYFKEAFFRHSSVDLSKYRQEQTERRLRSFFATRYEIASDHPNIFKTAIDELQRTPAFQLSILDTITINHSYFFRNKAQWEQLIQIIKGKGLRTLKIWSAGCSSGEEPYTMAMILKIQFPGLRFDIIASDIDKKILEKAKKAVYDAFSFDQMDENVLRQFFVQEGEKFALKEEIKNCVQFREHNLFAKPFDGNFDLIICRNVLIYFTAEGKDIVYRNFSSALKSDGVFFCGPTEQIFTPDIYDFSPTVASFYTKK